MRKILIVLVLLAISTVNPAAGQETPPIRVMVLGTFHFHKVSDSTVITAPERQAQIRRVVRSLTEFRPTKVALEEVPADSTRLDSLYRAYRAGEHQLTVNERQQLGFRLADRLGHERLYPIDYKHEWPMEAVLDYAETHEPWFTEYWEQWIGWGEERALQVPADVTIGQWIRMWNHPDTLAMMHGRYMRAAEVGADSGYVGANLAAEWYRRNLYIFSNLTRIAAPGDRIILTVGGGHAPTLRRFVTAHPKMELVDPLDYLPPAPEAATGRFAPSDTTPQILILGSPHISGDKWTVSEEEAERVIRALGSYRPDMVVVEYLPPSWEQGRGRDYRPDFDYAAYARQWDLPAESGTSEACHEASLYFLERDLMNAAYRWLDAECAAEADSAIGGWLEDYAAHEGARIAFPVARASGVERIISFDYQGEDTRWFLQEAIEDARNEGDRTGAEADSLMARMEEFRTWADSATSGSFPSVLRMANSPRWMEMQEHVYEVLLPRFEFEHAGRHQTIHYWIRNREMFERIEEAVAARRPERVLVVVGMGHKYFLDELARERGYRWVDPRDYLPGASPK